MEFDTLDRQLVHALFVDGRAPFSTIADVLGVSDKTIARRYARMHSLGAVRVAGLTDPAMLAEELWFLRVRCAPSSSVAIAEALARRPDTAWVSITAGGTEIVCTAHARNEQDSQALLLAKLPRTPRVEGVSAHSVLHVFFGGPDSLVAKHPALTDEQIARLRGPERQPAEPCVITLDDADRRLLAVLAEDGRAGFDRLVAATGWSHSTVRRRLTQLRECGALFFDVDFDWRLFGNGARTMLWLSVAPTHLDAAGRALAEHPEIAFAAATTGTTNLCASVVCASPRALYGYLTTRVAALPAITHVETAPVIRTVKRAGSYAPAP